MGTLVKMVELGRLSRNPGFQRLTQGLYLVLPDYPIRPENQAVYNSELLPNPLTLIAGYGLLYTVLVLAIALHLLA